MSPRTLPRTVSNQLVQTWLTRLLFAVGIVCLGYVAYVMVDAKVFSWLQGRRFDQARANPARHAPPSAALPRPPRAADTDHLEGFRPAAAAPEPTEGMVLGRIEIPRVGVSSLLLEGIEAGTLHRGAGHIPDTALPDQPGNVGIAAHRDSFFRGLKDIHQDDVIELTTLDGTAEYRVDWTRIVEPDDTRVLDPTPGPELTLVTCYPFHYVGSAPHRFIVRAHRVAAR
jgi:sortase A